MSTDKATTPKPAHREFWIAAPERYWHVDSGSLVCYKNAAELKDFEGDTIHVVEFKAFEALQNELDHCMKNYQDLGLHISKDKNLERLQKENEELKAQVKSETVKIERAIFQAIEKERDELKEWSKTLNKELATRTEFSGRMMKERDSLKDENAQLKAELEKAKSNELTNAVFAADEKLREELTQARAEKEKFKTLLGEARSRIGIFIAQSKSNTLEKRWLNDHLKTAQKDIEKLKALIKLNAENGKADGLIKREMFESACAERDAAIAAKKKAWEGNKQYEILVDSERAEKNAALAKAQAMEQALTSAQLVMDQALYVGSMAYPSLETFVNNAETCANEIREELAKWRGKK